MTDRSEMIRRVAHEIGELTVEKNLAYGDSYLKAGQILEVLYPNGIEPAQYRDALGVVRIVDKLFRIATRKNAFGESPWADICGYGLIGNVADTIEKHGSGNESD